MTHDTPAPLEAMSDTAATSGLAWVPTSWKCGPYRIYPTGTRNLWTATFCNGVGTEILSIEYQLAGDAFAACAAHSAGKPQC